jgi:hypothetical protein
LFGRFDDIAAQAFDAGLCHLRVLGDDRLEDARTHFHRLLHEIVEPALLQRREAVDKIGQGWLEAVARPALSGARPSWTSWQLSPTIRRRDR